MKKVYGMGIYEYGKYPGSINGKNTKEYQCWNHMLQRCYSLKCQEKYPTYKGCTVCDEWLYFQIFAAWHNNNYYEVSLLGRTEIDKDILVKGNKIHSPDTCVFVPRSINLLFTKRDASRGEYPIGVNYYKTTGKYRAEINYGDGKRHHLGYFNSPEKAFSVYKVAKEAHIKEVAKTYRTHIPVALYEAMMSYEVDVND